MAKRKKSRDASRADLEQAVGSSPGHPLDHEGYEAQLRLLQIELVKLQRHFINCGDRILVLLEGRDAAGKDGSIKRIVEFLSPRETRVVALGKPSDRERTGWYFQRYVEHLPLAEEFVLFNRSWYNRAGVESVMGFCTAEQYEEFMHSVTYFEAMLVNSGIKLLKYYLDISRTEQARRLAERRRDPLKQWKTSPIDAVALKHWNEYTAARNAMLIRTHTAAAPWHVVRTDDKRTARLNLIRHILSRLHYAGKKNKLVTPDPEIVFEFSKDCVDANYLAH
ncbi:polyphosphate kinase 2 [Ralstonia sp. R-29]|uniref:polyphosphate kinase 2 n=1 Tax=Ralstonia sp. R-29 TaxID=3404059 RepID=UPI003CF891F7